MTSAVEIAVLVDCDAWTKQIPDVEALARRAARAAFTSAAVHGAGEISVVLADDAFIRGLNRTYRCIDRATNVLAFPLGENGLWGDVIVAFETTRREAAEQGKPLAHHLVHLVVHGVLHLLGYDHAVARDAERMERREAEILAALDVPDPYGAVAQVLPARGTG